MNLHLRWIITFLYILLLSTIVYSKEAEDPRFIESAKAYAKRDFQKSARLLLPLVQQNPESSLYRFNYATSLFMLHEYDRAVQYFDKVITLNRQFVSISKLYKLKALKKMGQFELAQSQLEVLQNETQLSTSLQRMIDAEKQKMQKTIMVEDQALENYQKANWSKSEELLRSVEEEEDLSIQGRVLIGMNLMKLNKMFEAEKFFKNLLRLPRLAVAQKTQLVELLEKARQEAKEKSALWATIEAAYGMTNNVYVDGQSVSPVSSAVAKLNLGVGYNFNSDQIFSEKISYTLNYELPVAARDLKTLSHTLQGNLTYQERVLKLIISPYYVLQNWNDIIVSDKTGLNAKAALISENTELAIEVDASTQKSKQSTLPYLNVQSLFVRPLYSLWSKQLYAQFFFLYGQENSEDIVYGDGSRLPLSQDYYGAGLKVLWRIDPESVISGGLNLTERRYKNVSLPGQKKRQDQEKTAFIKYSYNLTSNLSIYAGGDFAVNTSTLNETDVRDKNFKTDLFSVGLIWDAL